MIRWGLLVSIFISGPLLAQGHDHGVDAGDKVRTTRPAREWTRLPLLVAGMGGERGVVRVRPGNMSVSAVRILAPGGNSSAFREFSVEADGARVVPPFPEKGNYHWLSAREELDGRVTVASTAHYFPNPGPSPVELLLDRKSELEIVPNPLPREHAAYRESEKWDFLVRFNGQALENKALVLETESGSRVKVSTNSIGIATVVFPRDISPAAESPGGHRRQAAKFVLAVEHEAAGTKYLTAFNQSYRADPDRSSSIGAGVGFLVLGMFGALPLLRRPRVERGGENA